MVILSFCREKKSSFTTTPFRTDQAVGPSPLLWQPSPPRPQPIGILIFHTPERLLFQLFLPKRKISLVFLDPAINQLHQHSRPVARDVSAGGERIIHHKSEPMGLPLPWPCPVHATEATWLESGAPVSKVSQPSDGTIPASRLPGQGPLPLLRNHPRVDGAFTWGKQRDRIRQVTRAPLGQYSRPFGQG